MYLNSVEMDYKLEADRRISAETCGLDDVFPPDDLGSGPYTSFIIYIPYVIATLWVVKIRSFLDVYIPKVGVAMAVSRMIRYCYSSLFGFKCIFQLHGSGFSIS